MERRKGPGNTKRTRQRNCIAALNLGRRCNRVINLQSLKRLILFFPRRFPRRRRCDPISHSRSVIMTRFCEITCACMPLFCLGIWWTLMNIDVTYRVLRDETRHINYTIAYSKAHVALAIGICVACASTIVS